MAGRCGEVMQEMKVRRWLEDVGKLCGR